jgi:hypothetical protein
LYTDPRGEIAPLIIAAIMGGLLGGFLYYALPTYFSFDPCTKWDWYQAAFWAGAGAVLVAAFGAVIYGGWWAAGQITSTILFTKVIDVSSRIGQNVWNLRPMERGWEIEKAIGRSPQFVHNFPTVDRFTNGIITSIKSIDLEAKTYQNIPALTSKVQGYILKLAQFNGASYGGFRIYANIITKRELLLAIPPNASIEQMKALQQMVITAANQGINLIIQVIK